MKVACICIPKIMFKLGYKCVDIFLFIYQFPKSNVLSFKFRMRGPLKESISCFLIRLSPLVLVPIGLFHRTQRSLLYVFMGLKVLASIFHRTQSPRFYLSRDSKSSPLFFIGLKVLTFIFHRTQSPYFYLSRDSKSSLLSFTGLKVLAFIFHRTQSPCFYLS